MRHFINLLFLAVLWGASFVFLRISSPEFGPIALIFVRTLIAALVLLPFILKSDEYLQIIKHWQKFLFVGIASTALPFCLLAYTTLSLSAGTTSILNATTPFFGALVAFYVLHERLTMLGALGLFVGFTGVYVLSVGGGDAGAEEVLLLPIVTALIATFLYAVSSVYIKLKMAEFEPLTIAAGSQLMSAIALLPFALISWPKMLPGAQSWISAVLMGVFSTALALVIFFRVLQREGVTRTIAVTYLIPVFGILWGNLFLGEQLTAMMLVGGILVLFGVALTTGAFELLRRSQA